MPVRHILLVLLVVTVWGANFVATKTSVLSFTPMLNTALRMAIVLAVLAPFVRFPKEHMRSLLIFSVTLGTLHFGLLAASMWFHLDIATCTIAVQMGVPFSTMLSAMFLGDHIGRWRSLGLMLCFAGAVVVAGTPNALEHSLGFAVALLAAFFWGVTNVIMKTRQPIPTLPMLYGLSAFSLPILLGLSLLLEGNPIPTLQAATHAGWLAVSFTAFCSTLLAYGIWYWLLKLYPITLIAPYNLLTPILGIAFGQMFYGDELGWRLLMGAAMTLAGVAVIVMRRPKIFMLGE